MSCDIQCCNFFLGNLVTFILAFRAVWQQLKRIIYPLAWALLSLLCGQKGLAQMQLSNLHTRIISAQKASQTLDSLTIALPIVSLTDSLSLFTLAADLYRISNNVLHLDTARIRLACPQCSTLRIRYRVLHFNFSSPVSRLDSTRIGRIRRGEPDIAFDYSPYEPASKPWESGGLQTNGAYTRGLSFGNNQNLVFNSNLNLQLNGKLGNDLELQAALSDNSIPLQPDGTTRQLQEFDRIFIQLKRKNIALSAGDFDLGKPITGLGYFSNYFKRLQGAMVEISAPVKKEKQHLPTWYGRGSIGISRGKFNRQIIAGQEGNQGPYRLQGAENERFIIILAGTEKVFIDGQQMRRGLEDDYVMDYNLGEITFTARRLVTKDSRIIVEFEYAVQNYLRSTMAANVQWQNGPNRFYLNLYSEQDSRSNGAAQELSPEERRTLALAGDNLRNAVVSGIDTLEGFDPSRVLYTYVDTLACGLPARVLRYTTNTEQGRYTARFTEVPQGQGNYVLSLSSANGRVFRWVSPDPSTCQPKGNYEPVVRLIAPESRQLHTIGADFQVFKKGNIQAEAALSNRDLNRFSPLGHTDNLGAAGFFNYKQRLIGPAQMQATAQGWLLDVHSSAEITAQNFRALNPYRPAEFIRDWNTDNSRDTTAERILKTGFSLQNAAYGKGRYEYGSFLRTGVYEGRRHFAQLNGQHRGFELSGELNLLQTKGRDESTAFSRPKMELSYTPRTISGQTSANTSTIPGANTNTSTPSFTPVGRGMFGVYFERERNARRTALADTLNRISFWYDLYRIYAQTKNPGKPWQWSANVMQRNDFVPQANHFKQNTVANELNVNGSWSGKPRETGTSQKQPQKARYPVTQQLSWALSVRRLRILEPTLSPLAAQNTYLGRTDYNLSAWRNALNFSTGYELSSGQSPRIEFNYLRVNPGEGQFTWVDRNRDSILQVDEMEIAVFQDQASFVRVAVTTQDYVRTNNMLLNQNLRLEPRLLWGQSRRRWQRRLSRVSTQSTFQVNRRVFADAKTVAPWNPFEFNIPDTALVALTASVRNVLFLNRSNPKWDFSIANGENRSQVALTTGYERRLNRDWTFHGRLNLNKKISTEGDLIIGNRESDNEAFNTRDFSIKSIETGPRLTWLPNATFRVTANVSLKNSENTLPSAETATQTEWNSELTWNPKGRANARGFKSATSLRVRGTYTDISYTGQPNTAVAFSMLEGLQNGKNYLWSFILDRQLSQSIQLSLNYEGRRTGTARIVHVGRAQVRALF